jgi:hypothetical protein
MLSPIKVDEASNGGSTRLCIAALKGHSEVVEQIIWLGSEGAHRGIVSSRREPFFNVCEFLALWALIGWIGLVAALATA